MKTDLFFKKPNNVLKEGIFAFFIDDKLNLKNLYNIFSKVEISKIKSILKQQNISADDLFYKFNITENNQIILIKQKKNFESNDYENLGAKFYEFLKNNKIKKINIFVDTLENLIKKNNIIEKVLNFIHGLNLKSYVFKKYFSANKKNFKLTIEISSKNNKNLSDNYLEFKAIESGVFLTRDLVSEPPNVLNPKNYVMIINKLSKLGLKIKIYNELAMKKLGMNALLGVGQGSINKSYLATIEWNGNKKSKDKPLAFVGKGVCFDTGGISLKPARFMEEMKYDMAGSAVVVGLLKTLALRKAKVNAVGVVGLVENMPGGNAQRPGDIVKSFSGKTIEILNTDAEGRLVLADAISFTEKNFKPKFIIDLATLTGAIIISLGEEYAGLFSNNDDLSEKIFKIGNEIGEKVWRLPLHENYNKLMNSTIADVQNINYVGGAGSITAAEFLQRFILNKTPWAHLDIAGMAFSKYGGALNSGGATGYGVRLLNKLIEDDYE